MRSASIILIYLTFQIPAQAQYLNRESGASGFLDTLGDLLKERAARRSTEEALQPGFASPETITKEQIGALIVNPATRKLGMDLYLQRVGEPGLSYPDEPGMRAMMSNPATQAFGMAVYRKKMGLPPER